jgi:hypothetical protein
VTDTPEPPKDVAPSISRRCSRSGCLALATKAPVLYVLPAGVKILDAAVVLRFPLGVCNDHAHVRISDLLDDDGWKQLEKSFVLQGAKPPSRKSSSVRYQPMDAMIQWFEERDATRRIRSVDVSRIGQPEAPADPVDGDGKSLGDQGQHS